MLADKHEFERFTSILYAVDNEILSFNHQRSFFDDDRNLPFSTPFSSRSYEVYVHISGASNFFIGKKMYRPQYGDVIVYRPDEYHNSVVLEPHYYERFVILMQPDAMDFLLDYKKRLMGFFFDRQPYEHNIIRLCDNDYKSFLKILYAVSEIIEKQNPNADILMYSYVIRLLTILNTEYYNSAPADYGEQYPAVLNDILDYINVNFVSLNGLEELSAHFNYSQSYLSRVFKKYTGITILEYIQNRKLAFAKKMLLEGSDVTSACYDSGFHNCSYFIQRFKSKMGITPYQYKINEK